MWVDEECRSLTAKPCTSAFWVPKKGVVPSSLARSLHSRALQGYTL